MKWIIVSFIMKKVFVRSGLRYDYIMYDKNKEYSNVFLIKAIKGGLPGMVVEKPIIIER